MQAYSPSAVRKTIVQGAMSDVNLSSGLDGLKRDAKKMEKNRWIKKKSLDKKNRCIKENVGSRR